VEQKAARRVARFVYLSASVAPSSARARSSEPGGRVAWRVVAANNRPLGRSMIAYNTLAECAAAVRLLHDGIGAAIGSVGFDAVTGTWRWTLSLDGRPVAICVNAYGRRIECQRALAQFLVAVAGAESTVQDVRHLGARALYDYELKPAEPAFTGRPRELARRAVD
jgi:hypothetical protein